MAVHCRQTMRARMSWALRMAALRAWTRSWRAAMASAPSGARWGSLSGGNQAGRKGNRHHPECLPQYAYLVAHEIHHDEWRVNTLGAMSGQQLQLCVAAWRLNWNESTKASSKRMPQMPYNAMRVPSSSAREVISEHRKAKRMNTVSGRCGRCRAAWKALWFVNLYSRLSSKMSNSSLSSLSAVLKPRHSRFW